MTGRRLVLGTRGSALALRQAELVANALEAHHPGLVVEQKILRSQGDQIPDAPLRRIGGTGLFTGEIERALLDGGIDLAVHSMKDLPTELPEGLLIGAVPSREDVRDVLISKTDGGLETLPLQAIVGTGSLRRRAQLAHARPDLRFEEMRGNLDTRLRKLRERDLDAIVLAAAGLRRMGWAHEISAFLPTEICLPAVGQAALAVEIRAEDTGISRIVKVLDDAEARTAVTAERAFLAHLGGGCHAPIGAWARLENDELVLEGMVASTDGTIRLRDRMEGSIPMAEHLGETLAARLLDAGARELVTV